MATYIAKGGTIDHTPSSAVAAGAVVVVGGFVGVATQPIPASTTGSLAVSGIFEFPKATGGALNAGATVYWDATNSVMTTTSSSNTLAGKVVATAASAATLVRVRLSL